MLCHLIDRRHLRKHQKLWRFVLPDGRLHLVQRTDALPGPVHPQSVQQGANRGGNRARKGSDNFWKCSAGGRKSAATEHLKQCRLMSIWRIIICWVEGGIECDWSAPLLLLLDCWVRLSWIGWLCCSRRCSGYSRVGCELCTGWNLTGSVSVLTALISWISYLIKIIIM